MRYMAFQPIAQQIRFTSKYAMLIHLGMTTGDRADCAWKKDEEMNRESILWTSRSIEYFIVCTYGMKLGENSEIFAWWTLF